MSAAVFAAVFAAGPARAKLTPVGSRNGVEAKLGLVDRWVRDEFSFVSDLMAAVECDSRDESGPGRSFSLGGRTILRAHPKRRHLALGFHDSLRADVEALTHALRDQRGAAWLNFKPGLCDRDTIEILCDKGLRAATLDLAGQPVEDRPEVPPIAGSRPGPTTVRDDDADLSLILTVLRAFKAHEVATGAPSSVKVLREALFFHWEGPRLPAGGKYSPSLLHSPAARERRARGHHGGLVFEHVLPVSVLIRRLLADVPADEEVLRLAIEASPERVIITKAEDDALNAAGMRNTTPAPDDRWSRYRAAGLDPSRFAPL